MLRSDVNAPAALDVKASAVAAGLAAGAGSVRVCSADDDDATRERFSAAVARGDFTTWPYDRAYAARAASPRSLRGDACSIVCVAVPFATPPPRKRAPMTGRVSNYAWAADYHPLLRGVLGAVAAVLDDAAGRNVTTVVCDTLPLAERAFAARAGVGWIGKHTNLIAPGLGSYVFLGEVVTSLSLPADAPLRKTCGTCRRCIAVCPTGALREDYTIDATRCISDLTQRKDAIPASLRPLIGDWIWGCDLCQEACPPTQHARPAVDPAFTTFESERAGFDLQGLLRLRSSEFKRRFRRSSMGWRGAAVLRRNAAVALGNSLDRAAVPALETALRRDRSTLVRSHAAWALGRIASPRAVSALSQALEAEQAYDVRDEIEHALEPLR